MVDHEELAEVLGAVLDPILRLAEGGGCSRITRQGGAFRVGHGSGSTGGTDLGPVVAPIPAPANSSLEEGEEGVSQWGAW